MSLLKAVTTELKEKKLQVSEVVKEMGIGRNTFYYQLAKEEPAADFIESLKTVAGVDLNNLKECLPSDIKVDLIERLVKLKEGNHITEEEYNTLKNRIIYK